MMMPYSGQCLRRPLTLLLTLLMLALPLTGARAQSAGDDMPLPPELEPLVPNALGLPLKARADDSFFDDALFVGDSVSLKLERYVRKERSDSQPSLLGKAKFFTAGSLGSGELLSPITANSTHPSYKGKKMLLEDAVAKSKAGKVYIMLGMNDIAVYGVDGSVENMIELIRRVRKASPKVQVFIQSATPRISGKDQKTLNNANLEKYDEALCRAIEESGAEGLYFVDVASALRADDGTLPLEFCSDPDDQGIHFTDEACEIWIEYLYTHTP